MAVDTRRCFWFGTEERMTMFATPLQGAESSPEGWSADGTLLNGGAYGLHSWGSHKRYTYEWPQSSSPETAQMMKSYRDGTYGRGLLYFLEPGIYRTNVLPAHWADPSMSLDNEAPSLVYNVDPTPVATSGGSTNNLPVTSAHYNLTGAAQTQPSLESSVFIPVPDGHTLFLGAIYSSTGTGGVYATPVNLNGTYGTAVKLTELANNTSQVVTDSFSEVRGIRLWVGRTTSVSSTVTLTAMTGRLLETSDTVVYGPWLLQTTNLCINPSFETGTTSWTFGSSTGAVSTEWSKFGSQSLKVTASTSSSTSGDVRFGTLTTLSGMVPGGTYTASTYINLPAAHLGVNTGGTSRQRRMLIFFQTPGGITSTFGPQTANTVGEHRLSHTFTVPADATGIQVAVGCAGSGSDPGFVTYVDGVQIQTGSVLSAYVDGSQPDTDIARYSWASAVNGSVSTLETRTKSGSSIKEDRLKAGPWIGGQGHSGCRFLGTPSYVTNSPIEGGRIGFAASFVEVGSWVYG